MKELNIINRLECHRDVFKKSSVSYQDMQDAINCIIGLKAENEELKQRLELLSEMEKEMRDLISRKALANELQKYFVNNTIHKNDLAEAIAKQPTVEAVPVVHCKDCEHWGMGIAGETEYIKCCEYGKYMVGENGYCVYGKKVQE